MTSILVGRDQRDCKINGVTPEAGEARLILQSLRVPTPGATIWAWVKGFYKRVVLWGWFSPSGWRRILGVVHGLSLPPVPDWVVPTVDAVRECYRANHGVMRRGVDARDDGALTALAWVTIGEQSPLTRRLGTEVVWEVARAESWVALCVAAGQGVPTERDWQRLGVEPRAAVTGDREFAYGAWRTLAWLLGQREDWPFHSGWHVAAEIARERPHTYVPKAQRDTDAWRAAALASRDRDRQDALRYWRHVRERIDATDVA